MKIYVLMANVSEKKLSVRPKAVSGLTISSPADTSYKTHNICYSSLAEWAQIIEQLKINHSNYSAGEIAFEAPDCHEIDRIIGYAHDFDTVHHYFYIEGILSGKAFEMHSLTQQDGLKISLTSPISIPWPNHLDMRVRDFSEPNKELTAIYEKYNQIQAYFRSPEYRLKKAHECFEHGLKSAPKELYLKKSLEILDQIGKNNEAADTLKLKIFSELSGLPVERCKPFLKKPNKELLYNCFAIMKSQAEIIKCQVDTINELNAGEEKNEKKQGPGFF